MEENRIRILTDPGNYSVLQNNAKNIDIVLITHQHQDHVYVDSLKTVLANNPQAKIITGRSVAALLEKAGISSEIMEEGQDLYEKGVLIEAFGKNHALIHSSIPLIQNTGYLVAKRLFFPGDAFLYPERKIEILALPVNAPWMRLSEAIDYAVALKPKICFPFHEGMLKSPDFIHKIAAQALEPEGIRYVAVETGREYEF